LNKIRYSKVILNFKITSLLSKMVCDRNFLASDSDSAILKTQISGGISEKSVYIFLFAEQCYLSTNQNIGE
jgi:hypothetical protein